MHSTRFVLQRLTFSPLLKLRTRRTPQRRLPSTSCCGPKHKEKQPSLRTHTRSSLCPCSTSTKLMWASRSSSNPVIFTRSAVYRRIGQKRMAPARTEYAVQLEARPSVLHYRGRGRCLLRKKFSIPQHPELQQDQTDCTRCLCHLRKPRTSFRQNLVTLLEEKDKHDSFWLGLPFPIKFVRPKNERFSAFRWRRSPAGPSRVCVRVARVRWYKSLGGVNNYCTSTTQMYGFLYRLALNFRAE